MKPLFPALAALAVLCLVACSDHTPIAVKATVQTFYSGIALDNQANIDDYIAPSASPAFRQHVLDTAEAAQHDSSLERSVQIVGMGTPVIRDGSAQVQVRFADGGTDQVSLVRQGLMWKILTSGRLG